MENLKCPLCASEPSTWGRITAPSVGCMNEACLIYNRPFPLRQWNDPALRIAEREAEKRGVQKAIDEASRRELKDLTETLKSLLK